jgi:Leucine-rich repeat (LRR) protein
MGFLSDLNLAFNNLTGRIPESFGNLTTLATLIMAHNMLAGAIPEELGKLASPDDLHLGSNLLDGQIPESLAGQYLSLGGPGAKYKMKILYVENYK